MLPRAAYVDPAVFRWEAEHLFRRGWICTGFSSALGAPGDQRAESIGEAGVLLTRDEQGELHCFANTCRHRGHELLACGAATNHTRVICPYHAWTYALDGELRAATGFRGAAGFDDSAHRLIELAVAEWHGLIFVNVSGSAAPLAPALDGLEEIVAPYEPERLIVAGRHDYEVASNWKILTENYHECYHCPMIHPELCQVSPPRSGENYAALGGAWVGGYMDLRPDAITMSLDGSSGGKMLRKLSSGALRQVVYVNIFPNVLLSLHPDYVMTHRLTPLAADRTRIECSWSFAPESIAEPGFDPSYAVDFWDITNTQDWRACESVQRGLSSTESVPGPLSAEEDAVYQYVTMVARAYAGETVRNAGTPIRVG